MKIIGITGKIASGKSYLEKNLISESAIVLNCDDIVKEMYKTNYNLKFFGWMVSSDSNDASEDFVLTSEFIKKEIYPHKKSWELFLKKVYTELEAAIKQQIESMRNKNPKLEYLFISGYDLSTLNIDFDVMIHVKCNLIKNLYRLFKRDKSLLKIKFWLKQTFGKQVYNDSIFALYTTSDIEAKGLLKLLDFIGSFQE